MIRNHNKKYTWIITLTVLIIIGVENTAQAYIGPGAGFAVMGSFLAIFATIFALLTWPVRYAIRGKNHFHPKAKCNRSVSNTRTEFQKFAVPTGGLSTSLPSQ